MTTVVLVCAVLASLAGGVLLAYALCSSMFAMFRIHSVQVAESRQAIREAAALAVSAAAALDTVA